jgi:hypothetical protein
MPGIDQAERVDEAISAASLAFEGIRPFVRRRPITGAAHPVRPYVVVVGVGNDDDAVATGAIDIDN